MPKILFKPIHFFFACVALLCLSGCREVLYSNLSEQDANDLTSVLLARNIDASKVNNGKSGYSVEVAQEHFVQALSIAKDNSLPKREFASLGSVFSGQGMISSQIEERSRLAFALAQELSSTFLQIDGVLNARVHVVLMDHDQVTGRTIQPSASIFIRHNQDSPVKNMLVGIKDTAAKAVPGLDASNVTVMTEEYIPHVFMVQKEQGIRVDYKVLVIGGIVVLVSLLLGSAVAYKLGYRVKKERVVRKEHEESKQ